MVFKPFTHLARQSFAKTFTHGYAQSVVAATQSSYASSTTQFGPFGNHTTGRLGRAGSTQLHNAFQNNSVSSSPSVKHSHNNSNTIDSVDGGLAAYYEAWQNQQRHGGEEGWKQFQFTKRIGWKAPSVIPDIKAKGKEDGARCPDVELERGGLDRAYSASAVDDIRKVQDEAAEDIAIAKINEAIAKEISANLVEHSAVALQEQHVRHPSLEEVVQSSVDAGLSGSSLIDSPNLSDVSSSIGSAPSSVSTAVTSVHDADSQAFSKHINKLSNSQRYAEIPSVFEAMLVNGLLPTTEAYNGLLAAAIHLPKAEHQIIPKALDVYSDMIRRKVLPDTTIYSTLIQLLSRRAVDVLRMRTALDQKRIRFANVKQTGKFTFGSNEAEYDILVEDNALSNAIKLFNSSLTTQIERVYSSETYGLLINACARHGRVEDMIRIYSQLEVHKVLPFAAIFPQMIEAFAISGDLSSAVECYNEYKALAISDDAGNSVILGRVDNHVYAAIIKAYAICGKGDGGTKFLSKVIDSYDGVTEHRKERLGVVYDTIILNAVLQERLDTGNFTEALKIAEEQDLSPSVYNQAMARICTAAADGNDVGLATKAYERVVDGDANTSSAALAMLALHVRLQDIDLARNFWKILVGSSDLDASFIEPTAMYAVALIGNGYVDEGLMQARQSFMHIRSTAIATKTRSDITEEIDEGIELIGMFLAKNGIQPSPHASMSFLWAMIENRGLVSPITEQLLAGIGRDDIATLSWQDLILALQAEADLISHEENIHEVSHSIRFTHLLEAAMGSGMPLDMRTSDLVDKCLEKLEFQHQDLIDKWQNYRRPINQKQSTPTLSTLQTGPMTVAPTKNPESVDPYAADTDFRGSTIIIEELDNHRTRTGDSLNGALVRFKNIRRAGRHPRSIVYAKLISAAAKEGRANLVHDILGMARQDIPYLPQYQLVRHGWASILDATVGACLTLGTRTLAARFHQELLDIGSAPTANTYGLYITTLKDSTRTFDEATEAVRIFHRAKSEGVEPSSFLYNALIGKLGKARRIDDCLFYFAEMRSLGIRPTSVTYGTIVNALCRVSDERFAEDLFDEMESMPNYKPRPAPYNSLMQYFLTTKHDSGKVLSYYQRMQSRNIQPTMHTFKLLIDTYATLDPINMTAAEGVLDTIRASGLRPEAVHYASLIHAKGCALHDMAAARRTFDDVLRKTDIRPQACLYQALFESMAANHCVADTEEILKDMFARGVEMTPYIANTLIHGWATEKNITKSKAVYDSIGLEKREPSTYEAMTRAFLTVEDRENASDVVHEMCSRGYPSAVSGKILELLGHGRSRVESFTPLEEIA
ncbi:hypothetical protein MMC12_001668 [Toensbergia leucococca]|nr:hypothetical protein [Toensbergia leucococca]